GAVRRRPVERVLPRERPPPRWVCIDLGAPLPARSAAPAAAGAAAGAWSRSGGTGLIIPGRLARFRRCSLGRAAALLEDRVSGRCAPPPNPPCRARAL